MGWRAAVSCVLIAGCGGATTERAATPPPVVTPVAEAPPPEPEPEVPCGARPSATLAIRGVRDEPGPSHLTREVAERQPALIGEAIRAHFEGLRTGSVTVRQHTSDLGGDYPRKKPEELAAIGAREGFCPTYVTALEFPHGYAHRAVAEVAVERASGERLELEVQLWLREDQWLVDTDHLSRELMQVLALEGAVDALRSGEPVAWAHRDDYPVEEREVGDDLLVLSCHHHQRLCMRGFGWSCSRDLRTTPDIVSVQWEEVDRDLDERGVGWLAMQRHRAEMGGAEMNAGDSALVTFLVARSSLALHGSLPIGGYVSERISHEPGVESIWESSNVQPTSLRLGVDGCVELGPIERVSVTHDRLSGRTDRSSAPAALTRWPRRMDGFDLTGVYGAAERDSSGAWDAIPGGGFLRRDDSEPACAAR